MSTFHVRLKQKRVSTKKRRRDGLPTEAPKWDTLMAQDRAAADSASYVVTLSRKWEAYPPRCLRQQATRRTRQTCRGRQLQKAKAHPGTVCRADHQGATGMCTSAGQRSHGGQPAQAHQTSSSVHTQMATPPGALWQPAGTHWAARGASA